MEGRPWFPASIISLRPKGVKTLMSRTVQDFNRLEPSDFSDLSVFKYEQETLTQTTFTVPREDRIEELIKRGEGEFLELNRR